MAEEKKSNKAKRAKHDWKRIKSAYRIMPETMSLTTFAAKAGVPLRTLQAHMKADAAKGEPWPRDLTGAVRNKTVELQQRVAAGLDVNKPITDEALAVATAAASNVMVLEAHGKLLGSMRETIGDGLGLLRRQINKGFLIIKRQNTKELTLDMVDVEADLVGKTLNQLSNSLQRVVDMERRHLGIDKDDGEAGYDEELKALLAESQAMGADDAG